MTMKIRALSAALFLTLPVAAAAQNNAVPATTTPEAKPAAATSIEAIEPQITGFFDSWMKNAHVPGLVYGVVKDGKLVLVRGLGVQDIASKKPVTADSRFRIASMSKAFTAMAILKLRDEERDAELYAYFAKFETECGEAERARGGEASLGVGAVAGNGPSAATASKKKASKK
jgi:CubicO group peptidase (beta-lactamase class C family)